MAAKGPKVGKEKDAAEEPTDAAALDAPAGGLDMPPPRPPLETEAFPGESQLTEDERNRWLILHFDIPRCLATYDISEGRTTELELNDVLSTMSWGSIDPETRAFVLESEEPTLEPPHTALISYAEHAARTYPVDPNMEVEAREENVRMAAELRANFTNAGEPGHKFRPMFDQMVKCLAYTNKALAKAYDIKKVMLNEDEVPLNAAKDDAQNIMRFGRHQILPSFWQLLIHLTKARRRYSIVFRTFDERQLPAVQTEMKYFCQGQHPAYCGQNKTQKPPPMNGEKGSRDMRLHDEAIGKMSRMSGRLEFASRPANKTSAQKAEAADAEGAPLEADNLVEAAAEVFVPTVYEFPPFHTAYAGLMHHILDGANAAAIVDDLDYWNLKDRASTAGKLLFVDSGGDVADTKVQHIFFDGHIRAADTHCVDVRDVVKGEPLPFADIDGKFIHRVDFVQAIIDNEYYIRALDACELKMSMAIVESRRVAGAGAEEVAKSSLKALPPKEYLYRTVIPALLPALEACQRDRPADPIEFIAFYMLRHGRGYSKTLKGPSLGSTTAAAAGPTAPLAA